MLKEGSKAVNGPDYRWSDVETSAARADVQLERGMSEPLLNAENGEPAGQPASPARRAQLATPARGRYVQYLAQPANV